MSEPPVSDERAAQVQCVYCGTLGAVRFEWREKLIAKPLGTFSITGAQMKTVARAVQWPWAVCRSDLGGCGHESEGKS